MGMEPADGTIRVGRPPERPVMIYDGACEFCVRWIGRWRRLTGRAVDYAESRDAAARFPEIPLDAFAEAVHLVEPSGRVSRGAAAALRSLAHRRAGGWLSRCYDVVPGVARLAEAAYRAIARRYHCPARRS